MTKFWVIYGIICAAVYTWFLLDTRYYARKKPSLTEKEIRDRIAAVEYEIDNHEYTDFRELEFLLDIKEYWEQELNKLTG